MFGITKFILDLVILFGNKESDPKKEASSINGSGPLLTSFPEEAFQYKMVYSDNTFCTDVWKWRLNGLHEIGAEFSFASLSYPVEWPSNCMHEFGKMLKRKKSVPLRTSQPCNSARKFSLWLFWLRKHIVFPSHQKDFDTWAPRILSRKLQKINKKTVRDLRRFELFI